MTAPRTTAVFETRSPDETVALGSRLGELLQAGDVVALVGELGAGKTHFVKGVCAGLGVADAHRVGSPTFVLCNEYPGRLPVFHLDAYRLASQNELWELGIDEMFDSAGVVLVEWADRAPDVIPPSALRVAFETLGPDRRRITLCAPANRIPGELSDRRV